MYFGRNYNTDIPIYTHIHSSKLRAQYKANKTYACKMDRTLCCNPIHVDDDQIDMELEEVWELQRSRSKGGRGTGSKRRGRLNILKGGNRRGFSLNRNRSKNNSSPVQVPRAGSRPMSTARGARAYGGVAAVGSRDQDTARGRSRSPWGRKKERKVSISRYVEKIETNPKQRGQQQRPRSRGRSSIAAPIQRADRSVASTSRNRSRSWSLGRRRNNKTRGSNSVRRASDRNVIRVRSKSAERKRAGGGGKFGGRRGREQRDVSDDSSSDDSSVGEYSTREAGGFFSAFR